MTRFLTASIWTLILVTLALLLMTGCAPTDPDAMRAEADRIDRAHARQTAQAEAADVRATTEAEIATLQAREAEAHEITMLQAASHATIGAIDAEQDRLDLAFDQRRATSQAWEDSLRVTQTMAGVQATQAIQPTAIAAAMQAAAARANMAQVAANAAPFVALIIILALLAAVGIGLRWLWMLVEWTDRRNGQVHTKLGLVQYRRDGDLVDRAPLRIPGLADDPIPAAPVMDEGDVDEIQPETKREQAIELLERGQEIYGDETDHIPGWRAAGDGWSSSKWQSVVGYLQTVGLAYKSGSAYRARPTCADAIYKIETTSPTPLVRVRGGE